MLRLVSAPMICVGGVFVYVYELIMCGVYVRARVCVCMCVCACVCARARERWEGGKPTPDVNVHVLFCPDSVLLCTSYKLVPCFVIRIGPACQ